MWRGVQTGNLFPLSPPDFYNRVNPNESWDFSFSGFSKSGEKAASEENSENEKHEAKRSEHDDKNLKHPIL